jgi:serine/threonine-protein kinase
LTKLNEGERTHRWAQVLPGSKAVLFTANGTAVGYDDANIEVLILKTGERKVLQRGGFSGQYLPSGHLVYLHQSTLFAAPFDLGRLALTGAPVPILEDAGSTTVNGGDFAFSNAGSFVYLSGRATTGGWAISWLDSTGKRLVLHAPLGRYVTPRISPDGKRLAYAHGTPVQEDIWVKDLERDTPSRLTFFGGTNSYPVWTPDGRNIVFQSTDPKNPGLYWIRSDGSSPAQRLNEGKVQETPYSFSPDGKRLAFLRMANALPDIWTAPIEGDAANPRLGKAELFLGTPFADAEPAFSPDGHWLAYVSTESGTLEVYVRPFPGPGGRWQISTGGGRFPYWSRSGHELLFEKPGGNGIMAVSYTAKGDTFTASTPKVWSTARLVPTGNLPNYDLAPDGKRIAGFLATEDTEGQKAMTHLTLLLNFFDELRRKSK